MTTSVLTPKTVADLVKMIAKHGKRAMLVSGVEAASERVAAGKVVVDLTNINALNEIETQKDRVIIGAGMNLGRLAREAVGENGLIRQASSLIANPLVRNRVTLVEALDPQSPYFDITTALALLDSKIRLQSPTTRRTVPIREFLEAVPKGLKKGEMPVAVEFSRLSANVRVGFFRVARMSGKGSVSAAARMRLVRNVCLDPEIVVSSLSLIPLRARTAEKEIAGKLDVSEQDVLEMEARFAGHEIGLDPAGSDDDESYAPIQYHADSIEHEPSNILETTERDKLQSTGLTKALACLDERSRRIVEARWLHEDKSATLHELAAEFNVSAERIRQIEQKAMSKMHAALSAA